MRRIVALLVVAGFLSACSSIKGPTDPMQCAWMFGAAGAVGGGAGAYDYARDHSDAAAAGIGVGSMLAGAALGYGICALLREEPPPPPKPAAKPPPPPKPPAPPPPDPCEGRIVLRGVTFAFDSAAITGASMATLDVAAETLRECPNIRTEVGGHTDSIGSDAYNQALSMRRAESVRRYLIEQDIAASRLEANGYGESNPVASNDTEEGRAQNRRVELKPIE